ncbi:MAG: response regulator transcription factor [Caulobacter sp.]|nr:response regulator transcription factor [Caulobacter sp.]
MTILVCDDHPLVRSAMAMTVEAVCPGRPVLTARDFEEAWAVASSEEALQLCLIDLHMPGAGPIDGIRELKRLAPDTRVIVVTGSDDDRELLEVLALGVDGFLSKTAETAIFSAAIGLVLAGGQYLPPRLLALTNQGGSPAVPAAGTLPDIKTGPMATGGAAGPYGRLSERQMQVLREMADGKANKEIARQLGVAPATIKTHVAQVIALLGAANRTEAAARARGLGLI